MYSLPAFSASSSHEGTPQQNILKSFHSGLITEEAALAYASRKSVTRRGIDNLKKNQGVMTTDIEDLALDDEYGKSVVTRKLS